MAALRTVVVGGGIVGLSVAHELRSRGREVLVLDRAPIFDSASCGNAGMLSIGHPPLTVPGVSWKGLKWMFSRTSPLYIRPRLSAELLGWLWTFHRHCNAGWFDRCMQVLCAAGPLTLAAYERWIDEIGISCGYTRSGWLDVCLGPQSLEQGIREAQAVERSGYRHAVLSGAELRARCGAFGPAVHGAVHWLGSANFHPREFMVQFARAVQSRGVRLRTDAEVAEIVLDNSRNARGVRLVTGEEIEADEVVLAAGVWSGALALQTGLDLRLMGARGYHVQLEGVEFMPWTAGVIADTKVAFTPMGSQLRLAGTLEIAPLGLPWIRRRVDNLLRVARQHLRGLEKARAVEEWAGYRPCTCDGMPVVGPHPTISGLWIGTGHAMLGMTLGPITGIVLAQMMCGEPLSLDAAMLSPARLADRRR